MRSSNARKAPRADDIESSLPRARRSSPPSGTVRANLVREPVFADPLMVGVLEIARRLGALETTVVILGETGVGKEVVARQIHQESKRALGPFVRLNCAALPPTLFEGELFGHERGAFTGADSQQTGRFEAAHGGTLFLDEIGELSLAAQVKLLNVLENREVRRLGALESRKIDVRILCATHRDLCAEIRVGRIRQDFFYRLSEFTLVVPPLRERLSEVRPLAEMFLEEYAEREGTPQSTLANETVAALLRHSWPGNVRELRNVVEHAALLAEHGSVLPEYLPGSISRESAP